MKKILVTLSVASMAVGAFAQGQVGFKNMLAAPTPYVYLADGTTKVPYNGGATALAFMADLYYGPAGTVNPNSLTALNTTTYFSATASQAGLFNGGNPSIASIPGGTTATLQIRTWETKGIYTSYALALAGATGLVGEGNLVQVTLSSPPATPPNMVGIQPIIMHPVPEPTVAAIAGLGLASMLILRRKK